LVAALAHGNPAAIQAAQDYWLKCSESLRKLDLALETSRREAEAQVSLREAESAVLATAEWMRVAIVTFLSAETTSLMSFRNGGEFKLYFWQRLKGILDLVVQGANQTRSPVPSWAQRAIETAWSVASDSE
jgi:hypothetical protein